MCGRCCLTLGTFQIQSACKYDCNGEKDSLPEWRYEYNFGRKYEASYNMAPTDIIPVLVSTDHFEDNDDIDLQNINLKQGKRCIVSMLWGMIPFWHKGDYKKHGLTTNNCRLEHLLESKLYSAPFLKGQRCVMLCEGFYEWQTTKAAKSSERDAYYIFVSQKSNIKMYDKTTWNQDNIDVNLLKLAGLFDTWKDENGDIIYSFSLITFESDETLSWLHHRTPAILETEQQVSDWLDFKRVPHKKALEIIKPPKHLSWYKISHKVNSTKNKGKDCNKPLSVLSQEKNKFFRNWLIPLKRKKQETEEQQSDESSDTNTEYSNELPNSNKKIKISDT